jgi:hypothetical protein
VNPQRRANRRVPMVLSRGSNVLPVSMVVARGRLAHEETTGTKVWIEQIVPVSGSGAHLRALATAVEHQRTGLAAD